MKCILTPGHPIFPYLNYCEFTADDIYQVLVRFYPEFNFDLSETNEQILDALHFFKQCIVKYLLGLEWKELFLTSEEELNALLLDEANAIAQFDPDSPDWPCKLWEVRLIALKKWLEQGKG